MIISNQIDIDFIKYLYTENSIKSNLEAQRKCLNIFNIKLSFYT